MSPRIVNDLVLSQEQIKLLHAIINKVYLHSEYEFWGDTYERISLTELELINKKQWLFVSMIEDEIVGCVRVSKKNEDTAGFSMLTVNFDYRKQGIANRMVLAAETWAKQNADNYIELELLVPQKFKHLDKEHLKNWYESLGYIEKSVSSFSETHPELDPILKIPCDFVVYRKKIS